LLQLRRRGRARQRIVLELNCLGQAAFDPNRIAEWPKTAPSLLEATREHWMDHGLFAPRRYRSGRVSISRERFRSAANGSSDACCRASTASPARPESVKAGRTEAAATNSCFKVALAAGPGVRPSCRPSRSACTPAVNWEGSPAGLHPCHSQPPVLAEGHCIGGCLGLGQHAVIEDAVTQRSVRVVSRGRGLGAWSQRRCRLFSRQHTVPHIIHQPGDVADPFPERLEPVALQRILDLLHNLLLTPV
jgi:hypothetical protein